MSEKAIKILLLEDHSIFRGGLAAHLQAEQDFKVVDDADDGSAIELIRHHEPHILLYNIATDAASNFKFLQEIVSMFGIRMPIIGIAFRPDKSMMYRFLYWGGSGYLLDSCPQEEYVQAIRCVSKGGIYICPEIGSTELKKLALRAGPPPEPGIMDLITDRERDVLYLLDAGNTIKEIAAIFNISPGTVANHKKTVMRILELHSISDLMRKLIFLELD